MYFLFFVLCAFVSVLSLRNSLSLSQICVAFASYQHADKCEIKWILTIDLKPAFAFESFRFNSGKMKIDVKIEKFGKLLLDKHIYLIPIFQISFARFLFLSLLLLLLSIACQANRLSSPHATKFKRNSSEIQPK